MEKEVLVVEAKKRRKIQNSLIHILIHHPSGLQRQNIHIMCYVYCTQTQIHSPLSQYKFTNKRLDKAKYPTIRHHSICSLNATKRDRMSVIKFIYSIHFICIFSQFYKCELFRLILNSSNCRLLCTRTNSIHFIVVAVFCLLFCSVVLLLFF